MGKLFWKFFLVFWLALLTAGFGAGTVVWLLHRAEQEQAPLLNVRLAEPMLAAAGATLAHGGVDALRAMLRDAERGRHPPLYAIDENGRDLLGREVDAEALAQARKIIGEQFRPRGARQISGDDGHSYLLFPGPPRPLSLAKALSSGRLPPPYRKPPSPAVLILTGAAVGLLFSAWLAWYFAKPIRNLRAAFDAVAQGNLDARAGAAMGKRRDELAYLGKHFDRMAGQVQLLMQAQQRLLHDVSHQLRSPLARMQAAIGLAQQQPEKIALTLERIEQESRRIDALVEELLTLSRLEAGVPGKKAEDIDIGDLLADIFADARFEAEGKAVTIDYRGDAEVIIQGQSELIHRAIENILRNAIQHSPRGGKISLAAQRDDIRRQFKLTVADQGPGVAEAELAAIFEPFFSSGGVRKEKSTGLGLSIAQRAIAAHGGKITAANRAEGGLRIDISLPF